ncbi:unnamed protein product [Cunninghamella blakesleeana]
MSDKCNVVLIDLTEKDEKKDPSSVFNFKNPKLPIPNIRIEDNSLITINQDAPFEDFTTS